MGGYVTSGAPASAASGSVRPGRTAWTTQAVKSEGWVSRPDARRNRKVGHAVWEPRQYAAITWRGSVAPPPDTARQRHGEERRSSGQDIGGTTRAES